MHKPHIVFDTRDNWSSATALLATAGAMYVTGYHSPVFVAALGCVFLGSTGVGAWLRRRGVDRSAKQSS